MKKFSLQTVLDYRKRLEDLAQYRFTEAKYVLQTVEQKLQDAKILLSQLVEETEKRQFEGIEITQLIRYEERISAQKLIISAINKNLTEKQQLVEQEKTKLLQRSKDRQIMERLQETQNRAWKEYINKKEAAMLDEIASNRYQADSI